MFRRKVMKLYIRTNLKGTVQSCSSHLALKLWWYLSFYLKNWKLFHWLRKKNFNGIPSKSWNASRYDKTSVNWIRWRVDGQFANKEKKRNQSIAGAREIICTHTHIEKEWYEREMKRRSSRVKWWAKLGIPLDGEERQKRKCLGMDTSLSVVISRTQVETCWRQNSAQEWLSSGQNRN